MWKKFFDFWKNGHYTWEIFQIEVSTYISQECQICPQAVFAEDWIFQKMPMEVFQKISHHFPKAKWISFKGWGDPLENEDLIPMLRLAKEKGCLTSLTTNGALFEHDFGLKLAQANLDYLVISLQIANPPLPQEKQQISFDFHRILAQVGEFARWRNTRKFSRPKIILSLPMTRLNLPHLPSILPQLAASNIDEAIFTNLDYLPEERWNILRAFYHESPTPLFEQKIAEMTKLAKDLNFKLKIYPRRAEEQVVCENDPTRKVFFSAEGYVAPCPYLCLPKNGDIFRIFMNKEYTLPRCVFGHIEREDFEQIWNREEYKNFRQIYAQRQKASLPTGQMLALFSAGRPTFNTAEMKKELPSLPTPCQTCYKAYGL